MTGRTLQRLGARFRRKAADPSVIALFLVVVASVATLPSAGLPSILLIPIAVAAVPVVVPKLWIRLLAAFFLTLWTFSTMAWTFYLPGWGLAIGAAARPDPVIQPDAALRGRRVVTVLLAVLLAVLGLLVARYGLLRRPEGWEVFPNRRYPLSNRRIDGVYGKRADGGCEFHHLLQRAPGQPPLEARMLGIDHRDCTISWRWASPPARRAPGRFGRRATPPSQNSLVY